MAEKDRVTVFVTVVAAGVGIKLDTNGSSDSSG